jgi:hypothetical protein
MTGGAAQGSDKGIHGREAWRARAEAPPAFPRTCASLLFAPPKYGGGGKNAKQVQEWLGHHSPAWVLEAAGDGALLVRRG